MIQGEKAPLDDQRARLDAAILALQFRVLAQHAVEQPALVGRVCQERPEAAQPRGHRPHPRDRQRPVRRERQLQQAPAPAP